MKILWPYLRPYRRQLIVGPFFKLLEAILELFIPTLMAYVIDRGIRGNDTAYVFQMGFLMLGVAVVGLLFAYICQYSASIASQGFGTRVRNALFRHIGRLSYAQTQQYGASSLVTRITNDVNLMQQGVAMVIRLFIRAPFICIGSIIMSLFIDWQLALIFVVSLPVFILVIYLLMRKTIPLYRLVQERTDRIATILRENLLGVRVIRSFAKKEKEQERFREANGDYRTAAIQVGRLSAIMNPATALIMNLVIAAILYFGAGRVDTGHLTQGQLTALLSYAAYMTNALVVLASLIVLLTKSAASAQRVAALLGMEPEPTVHGTDKPNPDCEEIVAFDHVTFSYYREEEEPALEDICFTVRRGEHIGVIGGTGAGKSTLIHLLTGLYPFKQGEIRFCGTEIRTMSEEVLRTHIAVAAQKALLLSGTVADNVRQGNPDASDSDILEALEQAQASFVLEKDQGIHAYVARSGANFSGGQKQRLSIARALARKPELLILDDSTSALDYATDAALRRALRSQKDAMTVITISQRVSSLMHCDKILVLEDGRQLGYDTHENLRRNVPAYARLCEMQLRAQEGGGAR